MREIIPRVGIDYIDVGPSAVYMGTEMSGRTKSAVQKFIGTKLYKQVTMRNYDTVKKVHAMLESF